MTRHERVTCIVFCTGLLVKNDVEIVRKLELTDGLMTIIIQGQLFMSKHAVDRQMDRWALGLDGLYGRGLVPVEPRLHSNACRGVFFFPAAC